MRKRHTPPSGGQDGFHFADAMEQFEAGQASVHAGDLPKAMAAFASAIALDPTLVAAQVGLGTTLTGMAEFEQAIITFERALEMEPDNLPATIGLGMALMEVGEDVDGAELIIRAVGAAKPDQELYRGVTSALVQMGFDDKADAIIDKGLEHFPDDDELLFYRALRLGGVQRQDEAVSLLETLLRRRPDDARLRYTYALMLTERQQSDRALDIFQDMRRDPEYGVRATYSTAMLLLDLGRDYEARDILSTLIEPARDDTEAGLALANTYWRLGEFAKAFAAYQRVVELDPDEVEAYEGLIRLGTALGKMDATLQAAAALSVLDPDYLDDIMEEMLPQPRKTGFQPTIHAPLPADAILQLKITLKWSKPPIWRRVLVPADITLAKLHAVIQTVMGWGNAHLHEFAIHGKRYGASDPDGFGPPVSSETRAKLNAMGLGEKRRFTYEYDFGDSWTHEIVLEKVLPRQEGMPYPVCIKGKGACPPEDIGGISGYYHFLEVMADPKDPEYREMQEWYGGPFDPNAFDIDAVNTALAPRRKKAK